MNAIWRAISELGASDWRVIATAAVVCAACALVGCFLVLRRQSLLGDAISHAILPGIAGAFLLTDSRDPLPMLAGAMFVGVLTALLSSGLTRAAKMGEDSALGVVFTTLFALGVLLVNHAASKGSIDLDPGCVLYGALELAGLGSRTLAVGGWSVELPHNFLFLLGVLGANILLVLVFYKELKVASFDPALARAMGISPALVSFGLMTMTAATTVASFDAVGSILVVAMLVAPGATAHLLTDRLPRMLVIAVVLAVASAFLGYVLAVVWNASAAGMIATVAGGVFVLACLFSPRHGVVGKGVHRAALAVRIAREDVLGMLYRWHEREGVDAGALPLSKGDVLRAIPGVVLTRIALATLSARGLVVSGPDGLRLSDAGRAQAAGVVRSHRLWESFLAKHLGLPLDHLHDPSHRVEHFISPTLRERLAGEVEGERDPHGKAIPPGSA